MEPGWPRTPLQWLRAVGNLVNLSTLFGLLIAAIGRVRLRRGPGGLLLGEGYRFRFPVASAFTVGNVIITDATWAQRLQENPTLLRHEERHTWQYLCCIGFPFYVLYGIFTGWSWLRTGDRAARNWFERLADLADGGYTDYPVRSLTEGVRAVLGKLRLSRS